MLKIKLFAIAVFLGFASCAFLFSNQKTEARSGQNNRNREEILEQVASYKNWKQVQKPEKKSEAVVAPENALTIAPVQISNSTVAG